MNVLGVQNLIWIRSLLRCLAAGVSQVLLIQPGPEYWQRGGVFRLGFSPHRPILISEGVGGQEDWKLKLNWLLKVVGSDDELK